MASWSKYQAYRLIPIPTNQSTHTSIYVMRVRAFGPVISLVMHLTCAGTHSLRYVLRLIAWHKC